jgi:hypothetical protein
MRYRVRFKRDPARWLWVSDAGPAEEWLFGAIERATGIPRMWAEKILENGAMIETRYLEIRGEKKLRCLVS